MADPITLTALVGLTVASQLYSGYSANKAAKAEASLIQQQGELTKQEADAEAARVGRENDKFRKRQKLAFLKNGVSLVGSPLLILEETRIESDKETSAIRKRGQAQKTLAGQRADITRNQGRASLIGGIGDAATSVFAGMSAAKSPGGK